MAPISPPITQCDASQCRRLLANVLKLPLSSECVRLSSDVARFARKDVVELHRSRRKPVLACALLELVVSCDWGIGGLKSIRLFIVMNCHMCVVSMDANNDLDKQENYHFIEEHIKNIVKSNIVQDLKTFIKGLKIENLRIIIVRSKKILYIIK